ncbi:unnamed protein product [Gordionus sp. m RMFG-2023]
MSIYSYDDTVFITKIYSPSLHMLINPTKTIADANTPYHQPIASKSDPLKSFNPFHSSSRPNLSDSNSLMKVSQISKIEGFLLTFIYYIISKSHFNPTLNRDAKKNTLILTSKAYECDELLNIIESNLI